MNLRNLLNILSIISLLAGIAGMLFCLPHLWSGRLEDLVGAGFPFVGGAILFGAGLLSLAVLNRNGLLKNL
jgi:hypothetical protein